MGRPRIVSQSTSRKTRVGYVILSTLLIAGFITLGVMLPEPFKAISDFFSSPNPDSVSRGIMGLGVGVILVGLGGLIRRCLRGDAWNKWPSKLALKAIISTGIVSLATLVGTLYWDTDPALRAVVSLSVFVVGFAGYVLSWRRAVAREMQENDRDDFSEQLINVDSVLTSGVRASLQQSLLSSVSAGSVPASISRGNKVRASGSQLFQSYHSLPAEQGSELTSVAADVAAADALKGRGLGQGPED